MLSGVRFAITAAIVVAACVLSIFPVTARGESVAMVTDLSGRATLQGRAVTILSEITVDTRLQVEAGGKLVVIYLKSGDEYTFSGPAQVQFRTTEPQVHSGAAPQKRASPLGRGGKDVTIKPVGVAQAGFVMRGNRTSGRIRLLTLSGARTLESAPEFRWQETQPGIRYRYKLTGADGKLLYETELEGTVFSLPASVRLAQGVDYTWELSAQFPDGLRYSSTGDFSLAPPELRAQVEALRPARGASVAERVLFAAWLEHVELKDEARKYWKAVAAERPDDEGLRMLAGETTHAPRSIEDVAAVLEYFRPDEARLRTLRETADAKAPAGDGPVQLAEFYRRRAQAARALGRVEQQVADLKQALEYAAQHKFADEAQILMNLGAAQSLTGDFAEALTTRQRALSVLTPKERGRQLTWNAFLAMMMVGYGDLEQARAYLERAQGLLDDARFWRGAGRAIDRFKWAVMWAEADLLMATGRFAEAEPVLREALRNYERWMSRVRRPGFMQAVRGDRVYTDWNYEHTLADLSRCLTGQGRVKEGEIEIRRALELSLSRGGRDTAESARLLQSFASNLFEQGRFSEADRIIGETLTIYDRLAVPADAFRRLTARFARFRILSAQGQWERAAAEADAMRHASGASAVFERLMARNATWPWVLTKTGRHAEAMEVARDYHRRFVDRYGRAGAPAALAQAALGNALAETGQLPEALAAFREAVPVLVGAVGRRAQRQSGRTLHELYVALEAFLDLLAKIRAEGLPDPYGGTLPDQAFRVAETLRSGQVQQAVAASAIRASVGDPALAVLVRREQDARQQILAFSQLLAEQAGLPPGQRDTRLETALRERARELETLASQLGQEVRRQFPRYAELLAPRIPRLAEVADRLLPGETLVSLYVTERRAVIWAIARGKPVAFAVAPAGRAEIAKLVGGLRQSLEHGQNSPERIPDFDFAAAYRLYELLLRPVETAWKGAGSLLVVTSGPLAQLPFGVLVTDPAATAAGAGLMFEGYRRVPWLLKQAAITQLPAASTLVTLRALPAGGAARSPFIGFGDPQFGPEASPAAPARVALRMRSVAVPRAEDARAAEWVAYRRLAPLPDTRDEILSIAAALKADPAQDTYLGARATKQNAQTANLATRRIVAFATHGLIPGELPGLDQPALALAAPDGSAESGLLRLQDILQFKLDADWVVLSACNTAAGEGAGAEAISGLGRGFFYAGSRALLVTHWPVETRSARLLVTQLFERYAADPGVSRAEALRQASLAVMDALGQDEISGQRFSYAHPSFWAPYALVGDGGR